MSHGVHVCYRNAIPHFLWAWHFSLPELWHYDGMAVVRVAVCVVIEILAAKKGGSIGGRLLDSG